ncbi:hypothetical protein SK128_001235, partial [Halocaridina rubra]
PRFVMLPSGFLLLILPLCVPGDAMWARLYSGPGQTGEELYTEDYLAELSVVDFDEKAVSICAEGVWLVYENHKYNGAGMGTVTPIVASNECTDLPVETSGLVTSIRQAGSPTNASKPTLTLYAYTNFRGPEMYLTKDWSDLDIFNDESYSAIVTGDQPWTVYTYDNYQGSGTCLMPDQVITVGTESVSVGLFPTYTELGSAGAIRSASIGCA